MRRGTDISAMVAVVLLVGLVLVGGAIWDSFALRAREAACERDGGVYVQTLSGFTCAKAVLHSRGQAAVLAEGRELLRRHRPNLVKRSPKLVQRNIRRRIEGLRRTAPERRLRLERLYVGQPIAPMKERVHAVDEIAANPIVVGPLALLHRANDVVDNGRSNALLPFVTGERGSRQTEFLPIVLCYLGSPVGLIKGHRNPPPHRVVP